MRWFSAPIIFLGHSVFYVPTSYIMYDFCTFQISVDFYYVPVSGRGWGRGGAGEGEGAIERGIECILYGYS
jgi:hypothetical protein